jgi:hypothetical protein
MEAKREKFPGLPLLRSVLEALERDIRKECDLSMEHEAYRALRDKVGSRSRIVGDSLVLFPVTHEELGLPKTDGSVVVEGAFDVVTIDDAEGLKRMGVTREEVVRSHIREQLEELLIDGAFDYDARPANWTVISGNGGAPRLGYFDKAQTVFLSDSEKQALLEMLFAISTEDSDAFADAFGRFEARSLAGTGPDVVDGVVKGALVSGGRNPYQILQDAISGLEQAGIPMSSSNSLKLSMFLRQIDRYIMMMPGFDIEAEITKILVQ